MVNIRGKEMTHLHSSSHPFPRLLSKGGAGWKRRSQERSKETVSQAQTRAEHDCPRPCPRGLGVWIPEPTHANSVLGHLGLAVLTPAVQNGPEKKLTGTLEAGAGLWVFQRLEGGLQGAWGWAHRPGRWSAGKRRPDRVQCQGQGLGLRAVRK